MADQKLSELTPLGTAPAATDYLYIVNDEATDVSQSITVANLFAYLAAYTGKISSGALTPVVGDADDFDTGFTGANLYGGVYVCNAAGTVVLPSVAEGMNFTIITLGDIEVIIDPNASDSMLTDGVQGLDGENITNLSTAGDIAVVQYYSSAGWLVTTNGWTPE